MKIAKVMLTALGVTAVVGAALASRATTERAFYKSASNGQCSVTTLRFATTTNNPAVPLTSLSTAKTTNPCPQIRTIQDL